MTTKRPISHTDVGNDPQDEAIIGALERRDESGLSELSQKYGKLCHRISRNLLGCGGDADAEECVNDTLLAVWQRIPPEHPKSLSAFVSRIVRNITVDRIRRRTADKRSGDLVTLTDELGECLSAPEDSSFPEAAALDDALNRFLSTLEAEDRVLLVRRYFHGEAYAELAALTGQREGAVRVRLHRLREKLRDYLQKHYLSL